MHELHFRMRDMQLACRNLRAKFLRSPSIPFPRKRLAVQAQVMSRGLYNSGTWPSLQCSEMKKFHTKVMATYRACAKDPYGPPFESDDDLIFRQEWIAPANLLRIRRLTLFARLVKCQAWHVLALVMYSRHARRSWASSLEQDFRWLSSKSSMFAGASCRIEGLACLCYSDPSRFKIEAIRICQTPLYNTSAAWASSVRVARNVSATLHTCHQCNATFSSYQACAVHRFKKHGIGKDLRKFVDTTHCIACMAEHWTRERILNHLDKSRRCRCLYRMLMSPLSEHVYQQLEKSSKDEVASLQVAGWRRNKCVMPAVTLDGPLVLQADMAGIDHRLRLSARP
eukprot:960189-Karenia_brevis.AAC.1